MSKILIVEDEKYERDALSAQLTKAFPSHQIFLADGCASALQLVKTHFMNIVLLDIMLNGESGFQIARFLTENSPFSHIIIVTAYSEFDFARTALELGISDYLLKPVRGKILIEKIRNLLSEEHRPTGCASIWPQLEMKQEENILPLLPLRPNYVLFSAAVESDSPKVYERAEKYFHAFLHNRGWLECAKDRLVMFANLDESSFQALLQMIESLHAQLPLSFGISECGSAQASLSTLYYQAKRAFACSIFLERNVSYIHWKDCRAADTQAEPYPAKQVQEVLDAAERGDCSYRDECRSLGNFFVEKCGHDPDILHRWLERFCQSVADRQAPNGSTWEVPFSPFLLLSRSALQNGMLKICESIADSSEKEVGHIGQAVQIINCQYASDLTLQSVAETLHYNAAYLSKLFQHDLHCSFKAYLIQVRMKHAKELLASTDKSITEIADLTGYNNANYFSNAFRSSEHCSPREYRYDSQKLH